MAKEVRSDLAFIGGAKITGLPAAIANGQAVVFEQLQSIKEGIKWKDPVKVITTSNINLASPGASLDGIAMVSGDRFAANGQTASSENGIYIWNGAATAATRSEDANTAAELNDAVIVVQSGTNADTQWIQNNPITTLGTDPVSFGTFASSTPLATETVAGRAEIATQGETDAGTDDARIVTPLKLKTSPFASRGIAIAFGDGTATQYDLSHNFNSNNVLVEIRKTATNETVLTDVTRFSANVVRVNTVSAPTANELTAIIQKIGG